MAAMLSPWLSLKMAGSATPRMVRPWSMGSFSSASRIRLACSTGSMRRPSLGVPYSRTAPGCGKACPLHPPHTTPRKRASKTRSRTPARSASALGCGTGGITCVHRWSSIVGRVVVPFGKHLPGKTVPVAVEQRFLLRFRQCSQRAQVARVIFQQGRVVKHAGRDKHPGPPQPSRFRPASAPGTVPQWGTGRGRCDEPCFHPAMPHPAGIGRGPDVDPGAGAARAVAAHHIAVLFPLEMGQLIEPDEDRRPCPDSSSGLWCTAGNQSKSSPRWGTPTHGWWRCTAP